MKSAETTVGCENGLAKSKIAFLAWGSLLWDKSSNERFDLWHGPWRRDGPILKLEFSRISKSRQGGLTLVIDPAHGSSARVRWCLSKRRDPEDAICDLRCREDTTLANVGWILFQENRSQCRDRESLDTIRSWSNPRLLDAVIWTDLRSNFDKPFSVEAAIKHANGLSPEAKSKTAEYVRRAPEFVDIPVRRALQQEPWVQISDTPSQ
jgi:hypothetical protein